MSHIGTLPITLITATPGVGKTALIVSLMQGFIDEGRPIFCNGIPELKLPHFPVPPVDEWTEIRKDPDTGKDMPYFTFPPKSVVVLDEAQRIYRPRPVGSKVPDHVAAFETVRHTGVTFIFSTQHPDFLDSHIRKLVGTHIHLRDAGVLGRWYYEWPEVGDPKHFSSAPVKKRFKLPKKVFSLYKSSSLHIKRNYSVPPVLVLLLVCVLVVAYFGWGFYGSMQEKMAPEKPPVTDTQVKQVQGGAIVMAPQLPPAQDAASYLASFAPMVPGRPETAPAYAHLRVVKAMPRIAGGLCSAKGCTCYTQQGTNAGLDNMQCRAWLENPPFDPYRDPEPVPVPAEVATSAPAEKGAVDDVEPAPQG